MAAYAYFTGGSASDTKSAHTGSTTSWTVSLGVGFSGGPMYPGSGTETANYTITNTGGGNQALTSVSASVNHDGSNNVLVGATPVTGCDYRWYTATAGAPSPAIGSVVAKNGTATGSVTVVLTESNTLQNACIGATPDVTINVA